MLDKVGGIVYTVGVVELSKQKNGDTKMRSKVFAVDGRHGGFIEFYDGRFVDTVAGVSEIDFPIDEEEGLYNSAVNYANENGYKWVDKDDWEMWSGNSDTDIYDYVGA